MIKDKGPKEEKSRGRSPTFNYSAYEYEKKSDKKPIVISLNSNLKSRLS
jgi:hypothetical protein